MSRDALLASLIESLIFWTEEDLPEDFADEIIRDDDPDTGNGDDGGEENAQSDGMEDGDTAKTSTGKGKGVDRADEKRQSMYVGLFEGKFHVHYRIVVLLTSRRYGQYCLERGVLPLYGRRTRRASLV